MCSGDSTAVSNVNPVLAAISGIPQNLYYVDSDVGSASSINLISQLLTGIHISAAAEAMAFGAKVGLDTQILYNIIKTAAGGSWVFENRVPAMLSANWTRHPMLFSLVTDLEIVLDESKRLGYPAVIGATAYQLYLMGASYGWSREADSGIVRLWESMTGVSVVKSAQLDLPHAFPFKPREYPKLSLKETINSLPEAHEDLCSIVKDQISSGKTPILVILDDDPTGTQTCHDITVLTVWDYDTLQREFSVTDKGFFILTNSRAFPPTEAKELIANICKNVKHAAKAVGKEFEIVLRGDSTLRGHFPDEVEVAEEVLGREQIDAWILAPFFYQGGRYTIEDIHYVAEDDVLVPAGQTQFAQDATFGYKSSNLRDYVLEKAGSKFISEDIASISLADIRLGPQKVTELLLDAPKKSVIIVNAAAESDMSVFAAGILAGKP
jgi:hypothetical protein